MCSVYKTVLTDLASAQEALGQVRKDSEQMSESHPYVQTGRYLLPPPHFWSAYPQKEHVSYSSDVLFCLCLHAKLLLLLSSLFL